MESELVVLQSAKRAKISAPISDRVFEADEDDDTRDDFDSVIMKGLPEPLDPLQQEYLDKAEELDRVCSWLAFDQQQRISAAMALLFGTLSFILSILLLTETVQEKHHTMGEQWEGDQRTFPPSLMMAAFACQALFSLLNMTVASRYLVEGKGTARQSFACLCVTLLAFIPFSSMIASRIMTAAGWPTTEPDFDALPAQFSGTVTEAQVQWLTGLGAVVIAAYAGTLFGGLTLFQWQMWAFFKGRFSLYNYKYYSSREVFYGILRILVGGAQVAAAACIAADFSSKREAGQGQSSKSPWQTLSGGFVVGGVIVVHRPMLNVVNGLLDLCTGCVMVAKGLRSPMQPNFLFSQGADCWSYGFNRWVTFVFVATASVQTVTQISLSDADPSYATVNVLYALAMLFFSQYLDNTRRHTPPGLLPDNRYSTVKPLGTFLNRSRPIVEACQQSKKKGSKWKHTLSTADLDSEETGRGGVEDGSVASADQLTPQV